MAGISADVDRRILLAAGFPPPQLAVIAEQTRSLSLALRSPDWFDSYPGNELD